MLKKWILAGALVALEAVPATAQTDNAALYGARESIGDISMSPDGTQLAFIQPARNRGSVLFVAGVDGGVPKAVFQSDGAPWNLAGCNWASNVRLVCTLFGVSDPGVGHPVPFTRMVAVGTDGSNVKQLGQNSLKGAYGLHQFDGQIIAWPVTDNGQVVMTREYRQEEQTNTRLSSVEEGLGVDMVDTASLRVRRIESPRIDASRYLADETGAVRIVGVRATDGQGMMRDLMIYSYRKPGSRDWKPLSRATSDGDAFVPVAVDGKRNLAYGFKDKDGRSAVYAVTLGETATEELLFAHDQVDAGEVLRIGRTGRVIGVAYSTDKPEHKLFDPEYAALAGRLQKALPGLPLIRFVDASRDESRLLLFAGSDIDPGRYYVYDKTSRQLNEVALARPELEGRTQAEVKPVQYAATDGTMIPAYLTLPPGRETKKLPAIVMPHGGPSARDEWGFDWLAQYYAAQGYAVIQPNFRGSAGYGDDWYVENGFKSWKIAVGDVNDAARWMVKEGIADPAKLAVVGWSYGGYAALQSGVLDPDLFKATVAIAPVTDLKALVGRAGNFTNAKIIGDYIGTGPHLVEGSPAQQAAQIKAPVLLFSGDQDLNVDISQSKAMEAALKKAGKPVEFVTYPGLDHQIHDSIARADMLRRSDAFLKNALQLP
ncbi:S9 family peptidase [Sphingopyxis sp. YF1]|uniref:alpha/beta hydrolase family protein n=1 Tax=Sphingopyxis sp. YF1 TaxID=2482763 RepID=UPI001F61E5D8|nr:S9 family peptidase [Sphingopyxis sp. YF1]UNU42362.1 S9 family peptidase [Sphingopyxis sp. YF1]